MNVGRIAAPMIRAGISLHQDWKMDVIRHIHALKGMPNGRT